MNRAVPPARGLGGATLQRRASFARVSAVLAVGLVATAAVAGAPRSASAQAGLLDLGTLGGSSSAATAVAGPTVVGWARTASGAKHGFAYDRSHPGAGLHDLGTLAGPDSAAVAVSGTTVVGWSTTSTGAKHAFAYDLAAATPTMVDLGTLAGGDAGNSAAVAVDGSTVVGWSEASSTDQRHDAFAADLAQSPPRMVDLGPGEATDVSGSLVSVKDDTDAAQPSGYLYRLGGATPGRIDLPVIDDSAATGAVPTAVDGSLAVGWAWSQTPANRLAFVYDVNRPDLGVRTDVVPGSPSAATAVSAGLVAARVGADGAENVVVRDVFDTSSDARYLGGGVPNALSGDIVVGRTDADKVFAANVSGTTPSYVTLASLGGSSNAVAVDGTSVAGTVTTSAGAPHAALWALFGQSLITVHSPAAIVWGRRLTVTATLATTGSADGIAGATLHLLTRRLGTTAWHTAATATTDADGRAIFVLRPKVNIQIKVTYGGGLVAAAAASPVRRVLVRPRVTGYPSAHSIRPRHTVEVSGRVVPHHRGHRVWLQEFRPRGWVNLKSVRLPSTGRFHFRVRPTRGWHYYRAFIRADRKHAAGFSRLQMVRVEVWVPVTRTLSKLPNVVVLLTDDQRPESMRRMRGVQRLLVRRGVNFVNGMVPTSLCCPSRATIVTGRYAHDTGVYSNGGVDGPKVGGWYTFHRAGNESRTLPLALAARGYRTGLIGKYLNYFGAYAPPGYSPPGWRTFIAVMAHHGAYYNYRLSNGERHGRAPRDYSTDVYARHAAHFIRTTAKGRPLFLYFTPFGPHLPYTPAPRDIGAWTGRMPLYDAPSVHDNMVGKPAYLQKFPPVPSDEILRVETLQQESLMSVDDAVRRIVRALRDTGRLHSTLLVFASDNGYLWGDHHQIAKDKPYTPALRIPLVLRWDGHLHAGTVDRRLALNVDFAATIARATGTRYASDGLSLLGRYLRHGFVLEASHGYGDRPAYCGWRTKSWMFAQYATGEQELYDVAHDPYELHNLAALPGYRQQLDTLRSRAVRGCSPTPPGFSWQPSPAG